MKHTFAKRPINPPAIHNIEADFFCSIYIPTGTYNGAQIYMKKPQILVHYVMSRSSQSIYSKVHSMWSDVAVYSILWPRTLLLTSPELLQNHQHDEHTHIKRNSPVISNQISRCIDSLPNTRRKNQHIWTAIIPSTKTHTAPNHATRNGTSGLHRQIHPPNGS